MSETSSLVEEVPVEVPTIQRHLLVDTIKAEMEARIGRVSKGQSVWKNRGHHLSEFGQEFVPDGEDLVEPEEGTRRLYFKLMYKGKMAESEDDSMPKLESAAFEIVESTLDKLKCKLSRYVYGPIAVVPKKGNPLRGADPLLGREHYIKVFVDVVPPPDEEVEEVKDS